MLEPPIDAAVGPSSTARKITPTTDPTTSATTSTMATIRFMKPRTLPGRRLDLRRQVFGRQVFGRHELLQQRDQRVRHLLRSAPVSGTSVSSLPNFEPGARRVSRACFDAGQVEAADAHRAAAHGDAA